MKLEINVGQIFLTHQRDKNFTSVYEESLPKQKTPVYLFAIVEIAENGRMGVNGHKEEYEKLARTIVSTLKRSYITSPLPNEETFEKALSAINSALSRLASKEQISVLPRLNGAIGAVFGNTLALSVAGSAIVYLRRRNELTLLSEGLSSDTFKPTKIFSNYASGALTSSDRVVISSREVLNFLSLERLTEFLAAETLEDVCSEIIESLSDIKDTGFAAYIFETSSAEKTSTARKHSFLPAVLDLPRNSASAGNAQKLLSTSWAWVVTIFSLLWHGLVSFLKFVFSFVRNLSPRMAQGRLPRSKKYLMAAFAIVLILFLGTLAYSSWSRSRVTAEQTQAEIANSIEQKLSEGEAALLIDNQNRIVTLISEIENLFVELDESAENRADFENRLKALENAINKEFHVENPTVLTTFESVPTTMIRSHNGFLAFNSNSGRLAFYDFRTASTRKILQNENTGNLSFGLYLGAGQGYIFLDKNGEWQKLDLDSETLSTFPATRVENLTPADLGRSRGLALLGENADSRLYVLDPKNQQIWRLNFNETGIAAPQAWLKTGADFTDSLTLRADSSIYVLYRDKLEKYLSGTRQNFSITPINPPLQNLTGLFVSAETSFIYLLDSDNSRVVVLDKQGRLKQQIISPKFRDLTDIYVDEQSKLMYILAGAELLQINLK